MSIQNTFMYQQQDKLCAILQNKFNTSFVWNGLANSINGQVFEGQTVSYQANRFTFPSQLRKAINADMVVLAFNNQIAKADPHQTQFPLNYVLSLSQDQIWLQIKTQIK